MQVALVPGPAQKSQIHFENYVEIHFEILKSTLKSRSPDIHVKYKNPIWNPKSRWNTVDFKISHAETPHGGPFELIWALGLWVQKQVIEERLEWLVRQNHMTLTLDCLNPKILNPSLTIPKSNPNSDL